MLNSHDHLIPMHRTLDVAGRHKHIFVPLFVRDHKSISTSRAPKRSNLQVHFGRDTEPVLPDAHKVAGSHQILENASDQFFF